MNYQPDLDFAKQLDLTDPLRRFRDAFHIPRRSDGSPMIYFCGHSLGLQPRTARDLLDQEMDDWANMGVEAHFRGRSAWYEYNQHFRESVARLVGAKPAEVVTMNTLTVNLHMMMATFYRPNPERYKILFDEPAFPSDLYAMQSQARLHSLDPRDTLVHLRPRQGESLLREDDIEQTIKDHSNSLALVWLSGVNFVTGQCFDIPRIAAAAHRHKCMIGVQLAHAAGNIPLALHDSGADFAVWCNYKYVNGGPGAIGGCFVHEKHANNTALPRLAGWWGNDPETRFNMDSQREFIARPGADGWQVSNPPILAMAPIRAALSLFDEAGMPALRAKSERLTGYMEYLLDRLPSGKLQILTPRDPKHRGCALSMIVHDKPKELVKHLEHHGVLCDFRPPNIVRAAPVPLYNTFEEVWRFGQLLATT